MSSDEISIIFYFDLWLVHILLDVKTLWYFCWCGRRTYCYVRWMCTTITWESVKRGERLANSAKVQAWPRPRPRTRYESQMLTMRAWLWSQNFPCFPSHTCRAWNEKEIVLVIANSRLYVSLLLFQAFTEEITVTIS